MALRAAFDTRFVFALFNPESGKQEEWCKSVIRESRNSGSYVVASTVTLAELYENMGRLVGVETVRLRIASMINNKIGFVPVDRAVAERAGRLKLSSNFELPLSDAIIAATAGLHAAGRVLTDDPHFGRISGLEPVWIR